MNRIIFGSVISTAAMSCIRDFYSLSLLDIESLTGCKQLRYIDASQNRIEAISANFFLTLYALQVLKLSENNIQTIPQEIELSAELR